VQVPLVARGAGMMTPRQSFTAARAELPGQTNNVVALSRSQNASLAVSPSPSSPPLLAAKLHSSNGKAVRDVPGIHVQRTLIPGLLHITFCACFLSWRSALWKGLSK